MYHELVRLKASLYDKPHMLTADYLDKVFEILEDREFNKSLVVKETMQGKKKEADLSDTGIGIIKMDGVLTAVPYYGMCGEEGVSHQAIKEQMRYLIDKGARVVVLEQNSPGGEAHKTFETAVDIREMADENDVALIAYVSSLSASASYAYSAVAHKVIINPTAESGSIGVRVKLRNMNGYLKNMGIEDVYLSEGAGKVPFDEEGKFTEDFLSEIKSSIKEMYDDFVSHVAMWRGITPEAVMSLGAKVFSAKESVSNGLADEVMKDDEFVEYLNTLLEDNSEMSIFKQLTSKTPSKEQEMSSDTFDVKLAELRKELEEGFQVKLEEFQKAVEAKDEELASLKQALVAKETEEKQRKQASRETQLATFVGDEKAKQLSASLEALDDESFQLIVSSYKSNLEADNKDKQELGGEGAPTVTDADMQATEIEKAKAALAAIGVKV